MTVPVTLGAAFDASADALRAASRSLPDIARPGQVRSLLFALQEYFGALRAYPDTVAWAAVKVPGSVTTMGRALGDIRAHFSAAEQYLDQAQRQSAPVSGPAGAAGHHLQSAGAHLGVSREVLDSHRGPDGDPLTPYLFLLGPAPAQRYVFSRITDLAWETGRFTAQLTERTDSPGVAAALSAARRELDQAVVLGRQANRNGMPEFGELPLVPTLRALPDDVTDLPAAADRLAEDCDRLVRGVFQAARGTGQPMSGTDLREIARSFVLGHFIAGRTLLHVAEDQPDPVGDHLRRTAGDLRESAQRWQHIAEISARVVDISDPRHHPALPRYSYADVRAGRANPMPRTQPHPATLTAHAISLRIGHLLYGEQWRPAAPRPSPRPAAEVLADTGGLASLLRTLHGVPSAARQLAEAGPHLLQHTRHNLVTDSGEHRPLRTGRRLRWYPASARQLDALSNAYHAAAPGKAATMLAATAGILGTTIPRAALDAAARRLIRPGPPDAGPPEVPGINAPTPTKPPRSAEPQYRLPSTQPELETRLRDAYAHLSNHLHDQPTAPSPRHGPARRSDSPAI